MRISYGKKIVTVLGARPQFIKAAAVSRVFVQTDDLEECLLHTGQHYDSQMSDVFFSDLNIPAPKYNLEIAGGGHGAMTGRMLAGIEEILLSEKPDMVLVYGDTNSTLAGALAAAKLHIPVAHVEAGLRSFNKGMPEELNRILTDHCSDIFFTPTDTATANLIKEGVDVKRIFQVGDVMYDTALYFREEVERQAISPEKYGLQRNWYILATVHRQENTDVSERLHAILSGLQKVSRDIPVILPLHPRTRARIAENQMNHLLEGLNLQEPLGYLEMVALERDAAVIVTDSGGVQKEAFFQNVPCLVLQDETGWTELVDAGWNTLHPPKDANAIHQAILDTIGKTGSDIAPYGDGNSAQSIIDILRAKLL